MSEHKVVVRVRKGKIFVSCECRATTGQHSKAGKLYFEPIGPSKNWDETREIFNDPDNHWAPFTDRDRLNGTKSRRG